jgi:hypothetical protein
MIVDSLFYALLCLEPPSWWTGVGSLSSLENFDPEKLQVVFCVFDFKLENTITLKSFLFIKNVLITIILLETIHFATKQIEYDLQPCGHFSYWKLILNCFTCLLATLNEFELHPCRPSFSIKHAPWIIIFYVWLVCFIHHHYIYLNLFMNVRVNASMSSIHPFPIYLYQLHSKAS